MPACRLCVPPKTDSRPSLPRTQMGKNGKGSTKKAAKAASRAMPSKDDVLAAGKQCGRNVEVVNPGNMAINGPVGADFEERLLTTERDLTDVPKWSTSAPRGCLKVNGDLGADFQERYLATDGDVADDDGGVVIPISGPLDTSPGGWAAWQKRLEGLGINTAAIGPGAPDVSWGVADWAAEADSVRVKEDDAGEPEVLVRDKRGELLPHQLDDTEIIGPEREKVLRDLAQKVSDGAGKEYREVMEGASGRPELQTEAGKKACFKQCLDKHLRIWTDSDSAEFTRTPQERDAIENLTEHVVSKVADARSAREAREAARLAAQLKDLRVTKANLRAAEAAHRKAMEAQLKIKRRWQKIWIWIAERRELRLETAKNILNRKRQERIREQAKRAAANKTKPAYTAAGPSHRDGPAESIQPYHPADAAKRTTRKAEGQAKWHAQQAAARLREQEQHARKYEMEKNLAKASKLDAALRKHGW